MPINGFEQDVHSDPAGAIKFQSDAFRLMPEDQAEEFARFDGFFASHRVQKMMGSRALSHVSGMPSLPTLNATIPPTMAALVSQSPPTRMVSDSASAKFPRL